MCMPTALHLVNFVSKFRSGFAASANHHCHLPKLQAQAGRHDCTKNVVTRSALLSFASHWNYPSTLDTLVNSWTLMEVAMQTAQPHPILVRKIGPLSSNILDSTSEVD